MRFRFVYAYLYHVSSTLETVQKTYLNGLMLSALWVLVVTGIFTLVQGANWVVFALSGGIYFVQSVLAYVLSYHKLDNREKYPAPYGYLHSHNALLIPTLYIVASESQRAEIDTFVKTEVARLSTRKTLRKTLISVVKRLGRSPQR